MFTKSQERHCKQCSYARFKTFNKKIRNTCSVTTANNRMEIIIIYRIFLERVYYALPSKHMYLRFYHFSNLVSYTFSKKRGLPLKQLIVDANRIHNFNIIRRYYVPCSCLKILYMFFPILSLQPFSFTSIIGLPSSVKYMVLLSRDQSFIWYIAVYKFLHVLFCLGDKVLKKIYVINDLRVIKDCIEH